METSSLFVMLFNQGMSFHDRLGSMKDYAERFSILMIVPGSILPSDTHTDGSGDTLVLLDSVLALLHLSACVVVDVLHPHILLPAAKLGRVDGDEEPLHPALLGVLHVLPGDFPVAVDVSDGCVARLANSARHRAGEHRHAQLEEEDLPRGRGVDDIVERARCKRRDLGTRSGTVPHTGLDVRHTIWMTPWFAAARVRHSSPSGWPSFPRAVADCPNKVNTMPNCTRRWRLTM